jgi:hypothetical protein
VRLGYFQERPLGAGQVAAGFQVIGQALGLAERPGLEGREELALVDQAVLKREHSEKEMAVSGGGHGMAPSGGSRSGEGPQHRGPARELSVVGWIIASPPWICARPAERCQPAAIVPGWVRLLAQIAHR